jgi:hypothetical protein
MTADSGAREVVLSVGNITVNLSCYGFLRYGRDFHAAAESFNNGGTFSIVPYFLRSQAIELGLKAFLLLSGATKAKLRAKPFGHNLNSLLDAATRSGLEKFVTFTPEEAAAIRTANQFYDSGPAGKRLQYFDVVMAMRAYKELPDLAALSGASRRLLTDSKLYDACLNA